MARFARIASLFQAERERWLLWVPVLYGTGIVTYFSLSFEPSLRYCALILGALTVLTLAAHRMQRRTLAMLCLILAIFCAGFTATATRAYRAQTPFIKPDLGVVWVRGTVETIEEREHGIRITLRNLDLWQPERKVFPPEETPFRLRINVRTPGMTAMQPGDYVGMKALLEPPPRFSVYPGGYDFARGSYFMRIGGVGYAVSPITIREPAKQTGIEWLRHVVTERIMDATGGKKEPAAPIAAALITGDQGAINKQVNLAMYNSGLGHILSISGLHLAIVMGGCFFLVRAFLALIPAIALRFNIKKFAAFMALAVGFFYLLLSGLSVPAERSYIMGGMFFLAVLFDRIGTPMLPIAWAGLLVLFLSPEELMGPSLQMSFASVVALIAGFQALHEFRQKRRKPTINPPGPIKRTLLGVWDMTISSFIAGMATAPYAIYDFGRYSNYSIPANLVGIPLTSFWVMPFCMAALFLIPLGLEHLPMIPGKWGLDWFIDIANYFNSLPESIILVPYIHLWVIGVFSLGGLWLCFWRTKLRLLGIPLMLIATLSILFPPAVPDVMVDEDGKLFAVKDSAGHMVFSSMQHARYARTQWMRMNAQREPVKMRESDAVICNAAETFCTYTARGHKVTFLQDNSAYDMACNDVEIWVNMDSAKPCPGAKFSITKADLDAHGAHIMWLDTAIKMRTAEDMAGKRFWTRPR